MPLPLALAAAGAAYGLSKTVMPGCAHFEPIEEFTTRCEFEEEKDASQDQADGDIVGS